MAKNRPTKRLFLLGLSACLVVSSLAKKTEVATPQRAIQKSGSGFELTKYGPAALIWFDGLDHPEEYQGQRFVNLIHELQPRNPRE